MHSQFAHLADATFAARRAVFLHKRDGETRINPHKRAFFGGSNQGTESYVECFIRELNEEIGLRIEAAQGIPLRPGTAPRRAVFHVHSALAESEVRLGEGAACGWHQNRPGFELDLTTQPG